jgi:TPR repeat protein
MLNVEEETYFERISAEWNNYMNLHNKRPAVLFTLFAILITTLTVYAKTPKPEDEKLEVTGDWEIRGNVYKLHDTPLGTVYNFTISDYFNWNYVYAKEAVKGKYILHSIQFDLRKFMDRREKIRRFIVLDFKVRTFPAITPVKTPMLRFTLTRSAVDPGNINGYQSLNGFLECQDALLGPGIFSAYTPSVLKRPWTLGFGGSSYMPHYEVISYRVILDTYKDGMESVNINGSKTIGQNPEDPTGHNSGSGISAQTGKWMPPQTENVADFVVPVRSFGLCIHIDPDLLKRNIIYRTILEVSHPVVTLTDREEVLRTLEPVDRMADYPYSGYGEKEIKKADNPDAVYAYAMRLLDGGDLLLGVESLKKAAARQHIFAMYQLGVCYYRGIGVEPDLKKSLEWLTHATEYNLPDAWALYGVVQMRSAKSPYLNDYIRGSVKQGLNALKLNTKHDNWALGVLLSNGIYWGPRDFVKCSPRLEFLRVKHDYIFNYYKDNVDPKIIPPPPKPGSPPPSQSKIKNPLNFDNSTFKKQAGKDRTDDDFGNFAPLELTQHKLPDKYYDIRVEGLCYQADSDELFKDVITNNYIPAILYQGRTTLLRTDFRRPDISLLYIDIPANSQNDALKKAAAVFNKGAKLGSLECETEALHCQVRLGKVKKEDFTPELDIRLADYPLYHMLKYMVENSDAPGVKEFLSRKYEDARQTWRSSPTAWNNFLLGAEALYQYYDYGFDTAWYRLYYRDIKDVETAFKYLDDAAKQNIPPAQYLCGKQYLEGMRSKGQMDEALHKKIGTDLLKAAEQAGYARASYLLTKQQFITNIYSTDTKWLEQLKPALDAKDADSWLLAGDIYARQKSSGSAQKALEAYGKAAEFGSIRAWHTLGMWYYNKPAAGKEKEQNKQKAAECWQKFVKLDREARMQDINDVYWPNIKKPPAFKLGDGDYSIKGLSDKEVRRYYETY